MAVGQKQRLAGTIVKFPEASAGRIKPAESAALGADPENAAAVLINTRNRIRPQAGAVSRGVPEVNEALCLLIETVQTTPVGADPEPVLAILENRVDHIVRNRLRIAPVVGEAGKTVAVVAVETVFGAEPHESPPVLEDAENGVLRYPFVDGKVLQTILPGSGRQHQAAA